MQGTSLVGEQCRIESRNFNRRRGRVIFLWYKGGVVEIHGRPSTVITIWPSSISRWKESLDQILWSLTIEKAIMNGKNMALKLFTPGTGKALPCLLWLCLLCRLKRKLAQCRQPKGKVRGSREVFQTEKEKLTAVLAVTAGWVGVVGWACVRFIHAGIYIAVGNWTNGSFICSKKNL